MPGQREGLVLAAPYPMADPHASAAPTRTWRPHLLHRVGSAVLAVAALGVAAACVAFAIAGDGLLAYGGGAVACVLFACWMGLVAFRRRLTLTSSELVLVQLLRERHIPLSNVRGVDPLRWGDGDFTIRLVHGSSIWLNGWEWFPAWMPGSAQRVEEITDAFNWAVRQTRAGAGGEKG
ncbi:hypothetical protein [Streptomyces sp. G1]|uniref:hypothetical protein n=1 Tax=Streptomyces sp. G1 TaxID=361572 RepID=UPI00202DEBFF|nr:hypothetical protein [Streptomyces sp. G1]MCM1966294.1 hypothetical protein [Streptomyces sp. G1]